RRVRQFRSRAHRALRSPAGDAPARRSRHRAQPPQDRGDGVERARVSRGAEGVRQLRRVSLALRRRAAAGESLAHAKAGAGAHARLGRARQGPRAARFPLRGLDHLLRVHAGERHGERPPDRLLPAPGARAVSRPRLLLSWSSGKDSAWALHRLRAEAAYEIAGLVTSVNERYQRVAIHAVREELLAAQAAAAGLPLWRVPLPHPCPNDAYERAMHALLARAAAQGVTHMAFGDLYLADVRAYRERQLEGSGVTPVFPLWGTDTGALAREMLGA